VIRVEMSGRTRTSLVPPRLASLPVEREQLANSSRSFMFVLDGPRLLRAWGPPDRPWVVAVEPRGGRWDIEAWGPGPVAARRAVRAMFSLDHPLEEFYRLAGREPVLRGAETRFRGLRIPRDASLYEALLHAIIGQQLSVPSAAALQRRLYGRTDAFVSADGREVPSVPMPSRVRALGTEGLRSLGMSRAKSRAVLALAAGVDRLRALEPRLATLPIGAAIDALTTGPGIGRWTAENALLRGIGRPDVFVAGDLGLRVALEEFAGPPRTAPESAVRAWGARYYPGWGSYATLYLWRKLVAARAARSAG
jgi:DNA-3-methyladenine glycosylase II